MNFQMKCRLLPLLFCFIVMASQANDASTGRSPLWIDVRTSAEYETGHLPGALNIGFEQIGARISTIAVAKDAPIIVYCKSGRRSGFAKQTLEKLGYSNVVNAGGISDVLRQTRLEAATGPECAAREC